MEGIPGSHTPVDLLQSLLYWQSVPEPERELPRGGWEAASEYSTKDAVIEWGMLEGSATSSSEDSDDTASVTSDETKTEPLRS